MSATTLPAPLPSIEVLACGCPTHGHTPGCILDTAEQICAEAIATAKVHRGLYTDQHVTGHPLIAALTALREAGILRDLGDVDPMNHLYGLLDDLWDGGLLGPVESTETTARVLGLR